MADLPLDNTSGRAQFFRQTVLKNLHYWQNWLETCYTHVTALDRERNALTKALAFALDLDEAWLLAFELMQTLTPLMERRGHWELWYSVLIHSLEAAQRVNDTTAEVTLSALLARLLFQQSRFKESAICYRRTIRLARRIGDRFNEARACTNLGHHFIERGYWHRAEVLCCHALKLFEQIDSQHGQAHTENHLGLLYTHQGRWAEAECHLNRACTIWGEMNDEHGLMRGFINLCLLYNGMKLPDKALDMAEKAFLQADRTGEELETGRIHLNVGTAYKIKGDLKEAETHTRQAEQIFRHLGNTHGLTNVLNNLGEIYLLRQEWAAATRHLIEALQGYRTLKNKHGEVQTLIHLATCEHLQSHKVQAQLWLSEAESQLKQYIQAGVYNQLPEQLKMIRRSLAEKPSSSCGVSTKDT